MEALLTFSTPTNSSGVTEGKEFQPVEAHCDQGLLCKESTKEEKTFSALLVYCSPWTSPNVALHFDLKQRR